MPEQTPQQDVSILEDLVVTLCESEAAKGTALGSLILGPSLSDSVPAKLPPWGPEQLASQRDHLYLSNGHRPTVSCKQVTHALALEHHMHAGYNMQMTCWNVATTLDQVSALHAGVEHTPQPDLCFVKTAQEGDAQLSGWLCG